MSISQLCEWLGVGRRFVEMEIARGNLRVRRLSKRLIRIMPADIEAWLEGDNLSTLNSNGGGSQDSMVAGDAPSSIMKPRAVLSTRYRKRRRRNGTCRDNETL